MNHGPSDSGCADIAILYTDKFVGTSLRPPKAVAQALKRIYPMVRLEWHPEMKLWTLWEKQGRMGTFIAALADERGDFVHPNLHNTIALLDKMLVRAESDFDKRKWLEGLDANPEWVGDLERKGADRIHEGSVMASQMGVGRVVVSVPRGVSTESALKRALK